MLIGIPPFYNQNKHQMYYLIEQGTLRWPSQEKHGFEISPLAQDLISKLLDKDKMKRLGRDKDVDDVIGHPWFSTINLDDLLAKKLTPPFVP
jgi:serine/threonine protein kinase